MKRLAFAVVLAAAAVSPAFAAPPAAQAHEQHAAAAKERSSAGEVASYQADTRIMKLKSGTEFQLAPSVAKTPRAGERVTVRWTMQGATRLADRVTAAP